MITKRIAREKYPTIPPLLLDGLYRYVDDKIPTGSFLNAVLTNNLTETFRRADHESAAALKEILAFVWWELPSNVWGNPKVVKEWLE